MGMARTDVDAPGEGTGERGGRVPASIFEEEVEEEEEEEEEGTVLGGVAWGRVKKFMRLAERAGTEFEAAARHVREAEAALLYAKAARQAKEETFLRLRRQAGEELLRDSRPSPPRGTEGRIVSRMGHGGAAQAGGEDDVSAAGGADDTGDNDALDRDEDDDDDDDDDAQGGERLCCSECGFACVRQARLREHVYVRHRGGTFACPHCEAHRATSDHLRSHLKHTHGLADAELTEAIRHLRRAIPGTP